MDRKIECSIVTPDRIVFEGQADLMVIQAHDGEVGFMYNHAPFISELGNGEARMRNGDHTEYLIVEGGFVEIRDNTLIVLAENAYRKDELCKAEIQESIEEIKNIPRIIDTEEGLRLETELKKQKARLKVASR
ncbi:MAG: ATP synthase F1 subunit epsilon [Spirochaetota bacterium]|nr:ATP synthase F1 subunit epsilon [Spirochaetota bacterium]